MRIPASNSCVGVLVIFLFLFLCVGCAQAAPHVYVTSTYIRCDETNYTTHGLPWLESSVNNTTLVSHTGTTWYINRSVTCEQVTGKIATFCIGNDTTNITKVVLGPGVQLQYGLFLGYVSNVEIEGSGSGEITGKFGFHDVYVHGVGGIRLDKIYDDIYNITIDNCTKGIAVADLQYKKIYNITSTNTTKSAVEVYNSSNMECYDFYVINAGNYSNPTSGYYGFVYDGCLDSIAHDMYVNGTGWSAVEVANDDRISNNITYYNMTIIRGGHNGIDLHGGTSGDGHNITLDNITCIEAVADNYLFTGAFDVLINNSHSIRSGFAGGGDGIKVGAYVGNVTIRNFHSENDALPLNFLCVLSAKIENFTAVNNTGKAIQLTQDSTRKIGALNITFVDIHVADGDGGDPSITFENSTNSKVINGKFGRLSYLSNYNYDSTMYYYLDVASKYSNNTLVQSGTVNISNNTYSSIDADGTTKTSYTFSNGRTVLPVDNRAMSPTIPQKYKSRSGIYITTVDPIRNDITVSNGVNTVFLDNVTPDMRWYRPNVANSNYTIVAIFNDSTDLHLTGHSPSPEYNTFSAVDQIKCQVWTNKNLTNVVWKVDGVEKQNGTATVYESTVGTAPITVDLIGSTATETITKSWIIDPTQTINTTPENPDPENPTYPPVANFTSDKINGTVPLKIQFNDTSVNATAWYWDFDNNGKTDSTDRNVTFRYRTPGNYAVKLTVSNSDGMNTTTKTEYITAEKQAWYIIIWNWFGFGLAGGAMIG